MCSLHPSAVKKIREQIEEVLGRLTTEVADGDLFLIKSVKRRGSDELRAFKECASAERYAKALNAPTPPARNVMLMQSHLEYLVKELRR